MTDSFEININGLTSTKSQLEEIYTALKKNQEQLKNVKNNLNGNTYGIVKNVIQSIEEEERNQLKSVKKLKESLSDIIKYYQQAEKNIVGQSVTISISDDSKESSPDKGLLETIKEDFKTDFKSNLIQDIITSALESGGNTIVRIGGLTNVITSTIRSSGENAFVVVNPNVLSVTSKWISGGKWIAAGAKYGLPVVGGLIEFGTKLLEGENIKDAGIKSAAHVGIGMAVGAVVGSIIPGPGTVAGAVIGLVAGTVVTFIANSAFDYVYDNWDSIKENVSETWRDVKENVSETWRDVKENASETWNTVKDTVSHAWQETTDVISNAVDSVGDAASGFFGNLGTIFG